MVVLQESRPERDAMRANAHEGAMTKADLVQTQEPSLLNTTFI